LEFGGKRSYFANEQIEPAAQLFGGTLTYVDTTARHISLVIGQNHRSSQI